MAEEVKLFRTWASSFAQGIVWALKIKGIEEYVIMVQDLSSNIPSPFLYNPDACKQWGKREIGEREVKRFVSKCFQR